MSYTDPQIELMKRLDLAHMESARRTNASSVAVANAAVSSGCYTNAIAAALMTLGDTHGPLQQTQEFLLGTVTADELLNAGKKIPGWGNSFIKGGEDPAWADVRAHLAEHWPHLIATIDAVTALLHERGRRVYPNPSAYTAAAAIALDIPPRVCAYLFVNARLPVWTDIFIENTKEGA